jgi:hypothetical protein
VTPADEVLDGERMVEAMLGYGLGSLEYQQQNDRVIAWLRDHIGVIFAALRKDVGLPPREAPWPEQSLVTHYVEKKPGVWRQDNRLAAMEQRVLDKAGEPKP